MQFAISATLRRVTNSPALNVSVGVIFLVTGMVEVWDSIEAEVFSVGAHHGAVVFGLFQALKNLPDLFEGLEYFEKTGSGE